MEIRRVQLESCTRQLGKSEEAECTVQICEEVPWRDSIAGTPSMVSKDPAATSVCCLLPRRGDPPPLPRKPRYGYEDMSTSDKSHELMQPQSM
jgi:hypothetical protein